MRTHIEPLLLSWLATAFPGVRTCTETPANLGDVLPCIQVVGIGGSGDRLQFDTPRADVDVFAASRDAARSLAQEVRASLLEDLPGQMVEGAFVLSVNEFMSPVWTPYDDTNLRRFTLSVGLRIHSRSYA